jgi:hypothetical protein
VTPLDSSPQHLAEMIVLLPETSRTFRAAFLKNSFASLFRH